jgi:hypothetical protein
MAFKPGESGNLKGRPKGAGSTPATIIRRAIEARSPELLESLFNAALAGDIAASAALLDRISPRIRASAGTVNIDLKGTTTELAERLLSAVTQGELTPADAAELLALVRTASGEHEGLVMPNIEALDAIYAAGIAHAESERLRMIERRKSLEATQ